MAIHRLAEVADDVVLGEDCEIWAFANVIRGARLGAGCSIGSHANVDGAEIGDGSRIGHGCSVHPGVRIGRQVFVGPITVFCNDLWPSIDKDGFDPALLAGRPTIVVGDGASIGAAVVVLPGVRIGAGARVAAGVTVRRDVPDGHLCYGGRAWPIGERPRVRMKFAGD